MQASLPVLLATMPDLTNIGWELGIAGGAVSAFLTTVVIGAILLALAPDFTERTMTDVVDDPFGSFVYGLISLVLLIIIAILLAITIVGLVVAIPLGIVAWVVWAAGSVIGYLAIADRLVGETDGWIVPLLVAATLNGLFVLTAIGGLVSFVVGAIGFGAILRAEFS